VLDSELACARGLRAVARSVRQRVNRCGAHFWSCSQVALRRSGRSCRSRPTCHTAKAGDPEDTLTALVLDSLIHLKGWSPPPGKTIVIGLIPEPPCHRSPGRFGHMVRFAASRPSTRRRSCGRLRYIKLGRPEVHTDSAALWVGSYPATQHRPGRGVMIGIDGCAWILKRNDFNWRVLRVTNCLTT
jgi:hypothetical protein